MRTNLSVWSAVHLSIVQIRIHGGIGIDKPSVDIVGNIGGIIGRSGDNPSNCVVQDGIGHSLEVAGVIDKATVWIEQSVADIIRASNPD